MVTPHHVHLPADHAPNDSTDGAARRQRPWRSAAAGAFVAAVVSFIWAAEVSQPGSEGLMGFGFFVTLFVAALPRAMIIGVAVVWVANKLVSWAPDSSAPWAPASPPPETIDGHFGVGWLAGFATPFLVAALFGVLPLAVLAWWLHSTNSDARIGDGVGVGTSIAASMLLVPRLARAAMREVDARIYARRR